MAKKNGRPPKYSTCKQLQTIIDTYFKGCLVPVQRTFVDKRGNVVTVGLETVPTVLGIAVALGVHRDTLHRYGEKTHKFHDIVTRAKDKVGEDLTQRALAGVVDARIAGMLLAANHDIAPVAKIEHTGKVLYAHVLAPSLQGLMIPYQPDDDIPEAEILDEPSNDP